ncbi:desampylase [Halorussus sp. AFM4]|uniref:desampylase n=1 Tax=Halorussus sp. AFM4 TaxID=3421651 RepID=UPI003EBF4873
MPTDTPDSPTVVVPESVRNDVVAHAREGSPREVCGVLAGVREGGDGTPVHRVERRYPAENAADRPRTRYEIDPREQLELMEEIEDAGREVVGFYHSHPRGPPGPSATDAAQATWPGRSYLVVSLGGGGGEGGGEPSIGSWRWTGAEFVAEQLRFPADGPG